jgi:hypothetical protein
MKTIITYFWVIVLIVLTIAANAQNSDINFQNTLTGKESLAYEPTPNLEIWEKVAGFNEEMPTPEGIKANYNPIEHKLIISGTTTNGDVEVWDVKGNTIFEKSSADPKTIFNVKRLPKGDYFIHYSNGDTSQGVKLVVN